MSSLSTPTTDLAALWRIIVQAGGVGSFVQNRLREQGFLVERRDTDAMSDKEKEDYKKRLKAEAAEKKKLRKEAWAAFRSQNLVHLGEGVHWHDRSGPDKWDLPNAEERAAENELPPLDTPAQLAEALGITLGKLRWLVYHREAATRVHYQRFTIPKRDGTPRAIWAPMPMLKAAQHWILRNVAEKLPVHGAAHGFLPGRSIKTNAEMHPNSRVIVKMDVKDFFPTVTISRVRGVFRKAGYREQVATLLALLCTEAPREIVTREGATYYVALGPRCLPQGAPTSPALTNTLCQRLDRRLQYLARKLGWRYTRYADDLTFSLPEGHAGKPQLGVLLGGVRCIVEAEGFEVHPEKTRISRCGGRQKVTGLVVNGDQPPRVNRALKRQLRAAAHNLKNGKGLQPGETAARLTGYAAYIHMTDPVLGRSLLDAFRNA